MAKAATELDTDRRNLRSHKSHELGPIGPNVRARGSPRRLLVILAERTDLIAKKGPPRLCWPSACHGHVARDGGLETLKPSIRSSPWIRGAPQRKFSRDIRAIRLRTPLETLGRPPRQRPRDRYLEIANQPLRCQRKTVSGWTIIKLSLHSGPIATAISKTDDQSDGSTGDEFGCAPAPRFDGGTRSLPTPARCGFGVRFGRPELLRLSPSLWKAEYRQTIEILN